MGPEGFSRRRFLQSTAALGLYAAWAHLVPAWARVVGGQATPLVVGDEPVDLVIARTPFTVAGRQGLAMTINGTVPGPLLRFREGSTATLRVTNRLDEMTSIHWHGLFIPSGMDGVPGVSFAGIRPGETFTYRFPLRQNGTYWYHSHSGLQEQIGHYAPLIIEPPGGDPFTYDRDYVVFLSDWTFEDPERVLDKLKKQSDYYNFQQRTLGDFVKEASRSGLGPTLRERLAWGRMRMSPADIADVTGSTYTYLMNGLGAQANWTGLFRPGERVRLRFINGASTTFFNVRIPGLTMTVVQADGQNVEPVAVDEFQIGVAETYDVIVEPTADRAYTVFAEAMDRSGYVRGTLAPREGMTAAVPELRPRPLRSMIDMGMDMGGMGHGGMQGMEHGDMSGADQHPMPGKGAHDMERTQGAMDHSGMTGMAGDGQQPSTPPGHQMPGMEAAGPVVARHGPDTHGPASASVAEVQRNRLGERGTGLENVEHRVLVYTHLRSLEPNRDPRPPQREIELHLTGNMEAFMWGIDGKKLSEARAPIFLDYGERVRLTMVNDTMMEHPMHLHGVLMELVNGADPKLRPRKHTVIVKPAERLSVDFTADEPGNWAFHCHLQYHMDMGMMRVFNIGLPAGELRS